MDAFIIVCPECGEDIGELFGDKDSRTVKLNLDVIDEINHLFDCPHCSQRFKVELTFTKVTYREELTDIGM